MIHENRMEAADITTGFLLRPFHHVPFLGSDLIALYATRCKAPELYSGRSCLTTARCGSAFASGPTRLPCSNPRLAYLCNIALEDFYYLAYMQS